MVDYRIMLGTVSNSLPIACFSSCSYTDHLCNMMIYSLINTRRGVIFEINLDSHILYLDIYDLYQISNKNLIILKFNLIK